MDNKIIRLDNVNKSFGVGSGKTTVLNSFSCSFYKDKLTLIIGSSGCGKSTLLNVIGGLENVDSGHIYFEDEDISLYSIKKLTSYRKEKVGFVFQSSNLLNDLTVKENISLVANLCHSKLDINKIIADVGLSGKENKYPFELSGGERHRVAIARVLVKDTPLILLDEPTGALDYQTGKQILKLVTDLVNVHHKSVIMVTHTKEISKIANYVIEMRSGTIINEYANDNVLDVESVEW